MTQNIICITLFLKLFALDDDIHVLPKDPNEIMYFDETRGRNGDEEHFFGTGIFFSLHMVIVPRYYLLAYQLQF